MVCHPESTRFKKGKLISVTAHGRENGCLAQQPGRAGGDERQMPHPG